MRTTENWQLLVVGIFLTSCSLPSEQHTQIVRQATDPGGEPCPWEGDGTTLSEGGQFDIAVIVGSTGRLGTEVDCRATAFIGVRNDGPGNPPPRAPPTSSVVGADTYMLISDDADGSEVYNQRIPGDTDQSTPFREGCYKFRNRVTAIRTLDNFQVNHSYSIACFYRSTVTRYKDVDGLPEVDSVGTLARGFGHTLYGHRGEY